MKVIDEFRYRGDKYRLAKIDSTDDSSVRKQRLELLYNGDVEGQWFSGDDPELDKEALMHRLEELRTKILALADS